MASAQTRWQIAGGYFQNCNVKGLLHSPGAPRQHLTTN